MEPHNKYIELFQKKTTLDELSGLWGLFPILTIGVILTGFIGVIIMATKKIKKIIKQVEMPKGWVSTLARVKGEEEERKAVLEKYGKKPTNWKWLLKDWKVWAILIFIVITIIGSALFSGNNDVVNTQTQPSVTQKSTQNTVQPNPDNATQTNIESVLGNSINFITTTIIISMVLMIGMMIFRAIGKGLK